MGSARRLFTTCPVCSASCVALASLEASSLLPAFKNLGRGVF